MLAIKPRLVWAATPSCQPKPSNIMTTLPSIHLIIVTGQAQANLIPILQLKPAIVALAISESMRENAKVFVKLLTKLANYKDADILPFAVPDAGFEAIRYRALEIEDELRRNYRNSPITYHATGGTKIMALGFYQVFQGQSDTVLYTDTVHGQIETLHPEKAPAIMIGKVLTIESYLLSMDKTYRKHADAAWENKARQRRSLSFWLVQNIEDLQDFWPAMNKLVQDALAKEQRGVPPSLVRPEQQFDRNPTNVLWQQALKKIAEAGICQWDNQKPEVLYFDNPDGAKYLGGAWIEEYVWLTASELGCEQVWANVEFTEAASPKDDIRNEMDCLILHNNRLSMIECKTSKFTNGQSRNSDILYKLKTLEHSAGGLFGDAWLISALKLDEKTQNRAREYKINVIDSTKLNTLQDAIRNWMNRKQ